MTKFFFGPPTGSRMTGRLTRTDTAAFLDFDINAVGVPPTTTGPNASFSITLNGAPVDFIAPCAVFFRCANFTGFRGFDGNPISEPAGNANVYDPTQHEITVEWFFPDESYTPLVTPNIPTAWRNRNVATGKQVAHVFTTTGNKEVTAFAFDSQGNWGFASYTFQAGGNSPAIVSQDSLFPTTKTIVWSQSLTIGDTWPGAPAGAVQCNTIAQVHAAMRSNFSLSGVQNKQCRVLLRRGETFTDVGYFDVSVSGTGFPGGTSYDYRNACKGLVLGAFGTGAEPIIQNTAFFGWNIRTPDRSDFRQLIVQDIDFRGDYDATKETGRTSAVFQAEPCVYSVLFHRVKASGHGVPFILQSGTPDGGTNPSNVYFHDCDVTNFKDYGLQFPRSYKLAVMGCDLRQAEDALCGINHGIGGQTPWNMGNAHVGLRFTSLFDSYVSRTSVYNRGGWSNDLNAAATEFPPTNEQGVRLFTGFDVDPPGVDVDTRRHHHMWDRVTIEGGQAPIEIGPTRGNHVPANFVIDKILVVGSAKSATTLIRARGGATIRNGYAYRFAIPTQGGNVGEVKADFECRNFEDNPTVNNPAFPGRIYNCTSINNLATGDLAPGHTPFFVASYYAAGSGVWNNVGVVPSRSVGGSFAPLGASPLAGFVCRGPGLRWGFPPIGSPSWGSPILTQNLREGGVGAVAPGEWIRVNYPDYTGKCRGANAFGPLGQVTRAIVLANSTQKHEVSISNVSTKRMGDSTLWSNADGRVIFDFPVGQTYFRIQNNTASTWPINGQVWVKLDLTDYHMSGKAGTSIAGNTIPLPRPLAGSSALSTGSALPRTIADFFGTRKPGSRTNTGTFVPGSASQGAFEPV
jgi:hypothetical protein